eukprot:GFYU01002508.1.p1 GENE.GFYU01002508.1~~GFYU01002508.1.p1  ORF type:complete len:319 (+),score=31.62 GFYU01002508.1:204-1160(+)
MVKVHTDEVTKTFYAPKWSAPHCFTNAYFLALFILPFAIAYSSHGFWLTENSYREQPTISFKHEYVMTVSSAADGRTYVGTSSSNVNRAYLPIGNHRSTLFKSWFEDVNRDGKDDFLHFDIKMSHGGVQVNECRVLLILNYELSKRVSLKMEAAAYVSQSSPIKGGSMMIDGVLELRQTGPLPDFTQRITYDTSIMPAAETISSGQLNMADLLSSYTSRNETIVVRENYVLWEPAQDLDTTFTVKGKLRIPTQVVLYSPGFAESMKWAWVQYFTTGCFLLLFFRPAKRFMFNQRVFNTQVKYESSARTEFDPSKVKPF